MSKNHLPVLSLLLAAGCVYGMALHAEGTLKVCADPAYLPYSNQAGQGFENEVAELTAKALDMKLEYVWDDTRGPGGYSHFLQNLDVGNCDVVVDLPYINQEELTTKPYYVSSYVFVSRKTKNYDLSGGMDSPVLHKLKIGFESETPVEGGLQLRGMVTTAKAYDVGGQAGRSPRDMLQAVQDGTVDVMITWQPAISAWLKDYPDLGIVTVPDTRATGSPEMYSFPMSMAVHTGNTKMQARLDAVIKQHKGDLTAILQRHGVKLFGGSVGGGSGSLGLVQR